MGFLVLFSRIYFGEFVLFLIFVSYTTAHTKHKHRLEAVLLLPYLAVENVSFAGLSCDFIDF